MELAIDTGLVAAILPELLPMKGMLLGSRCNPTRISGTHTMRVLEPITRRPQLSRWLMAGLLHDVGKPQIRQASVKWSHVCHHHEQVGAIFSDRICRDLKLSNAERERIGLARVEFIMPWCKAENVASLPAEADFG